MWGESAVAVRVQVGFGLLGLAAVGCIAMDSPLIEESAAGCAELASAELSASAAVDADVRELMMAAVTLRTAVAQLRGSVLDACARIALTTGAGDTWSASASLDEAITNLRGTGACDRAALQVAGGPLRGSARLTVAPECRYDVAAQLECERTCAGRELCLERCRATAKAFAACTGGRVEVAIDTRQHAALLPAASMLEQSLPVLLEAEARRELLQTSIDELGAVGSRTAEFRGDDLDGKSVACVGESSTALVREVGSLAVCSAGSERVLLATGAWRP